MSRTLSRSVTLAAAACLLPGVLAAQQWEGTITTRDVSFRASLLGPGVEANLEAVLDLALPDILAAGERPDAADHDFTTSSATLKVKGTRIRTDLSGPMAAEMGGGFGVMDVAEGVMYMVVPAQRMIMEVNVAEMEQLMAAMGNPADEPEPVDAEPLGGTRTINGVECASYRLVTPEGVVTVTWVSDTDEALHEVYREFADLAGAMAEPGEVDPELVLAPYGFPMLTYTLNPDGTIQIEETLSIEPGPVPDETFTLPEGYQTMSMVDLMRQQMQNN